MLKKLFLILSTAPVAISVANAQVSLAMDNDISSSQKELTEINKRYIGGFTHTPLFYFGVTQDDNIYPLDGGLAVSDVYATARYSSDFTSNWNRHQLSIKGYLGHDQYEEATDFSGTEYGLALNGRVDVGTEGKFDAGIGYESKFMDSRDPATPFGAAERVQMDTTTFRVGFSQNLYRYMVGVGAGYTSMDASDVKGRFVQSIEQDFRDNDVTDAYLKVSYAFSPNISAYGSVSYDEVEYKPPAGLPDTSSSGYVGSVGLDFSITDLVSGNIELGQRQREYTDTSREKFDGVVAKSSVTWYPKRDTSVVFNLFKNVEDSFLPGANYLEVTNYNFNFTHKFTNNLYARARIGQKMDAYSGFDRDDSTLYAGAGLDFHVRRNIGLALDVDYYDLASDGARSITDYENLVVTLSSKFYF